MNESDLYIKICRYRILAIFTNTHTHTRKKIQIWLTFEPKKNETQTFYIKSGNRIEFIMNIVNGNSLLLTHTHTQTMSE